MTNDVSCSSILISYSIYLVLKPPTKNPFEKRLYSSYSKTIDHFVFVHKADSSSRPSTISVSEIFIDNTNKLLGKERSMGGFSYCYDSSSCSNAS